MKLRAGKMLVPVIIAVAVVAGALSFTTNSAAQSADQSASGHGTLLVQNAAGDFVRRQFSFSARRYDDGSVKGQATLHNPAVESGKNQRYQLQIDITCMKVVGNVAIFGGTTRRTNDPNLVDAVFFSVQDNGEPGRDRDKISRAFFFDDDPNTVGDPQICQANQPTDFPLETIESGNIQVRGGTTP
ncbi:MAG TPA: hypothetical protein VGX48_06155 [Pyrinomonadaceae bacterium]|jgi:hypothetical protein|nr:hypothetical protein [Pyrinomonadaceae bacterium]